MSKPNKLSTTVARINLLPAGWRAGVRSFLLGKVIPYAGTSGVRFDVLTNEQCVVSIRYRRKVGNHIGTLHAAAMALAAESATGFVCAMNIPDSKVLVIKTMELNYLKRTKGTLTATATLSDAERQRMIEEPKGEVLVPCTLADETGGETVTADMTWAWTEKRK